MTGIKPSDLKDQLHLVNTAQMPEPDDVVELSCREVDQAFTFSRVWDIARALPCS